jgi:geranylgeranyl diphosphate synthase type I
MLDDILTSRKEIKNYLISFFARKKGFFDEINRFGREVPEHLLKLAAAGKMVRGQLLVYINDAFGGQNRQDAINVAAATELFQTGLVVHDDIMDQDETRRGLTTFHAKYRKEAAGYGIKTAQDKFGNNLAICAGDLAFFLALEILGETESYKQISRLFKAIGAEYCLVTLGQMADIYHAQTEKELTENDILNCYRFKTARYSFSLPLMGGAILAGKGEDNLLTKVGLLGEMIGMVYQLRDDQLGIFGNPKITGKPVLSDIRENKKTYYYYLLANSAPGSLRDEVLAMFGKADLTDEDTDKVKKFLIKHKIGQKATQLVSKYQKQAEKILEELRFSAKTTADLHYLIRFSATRSK